MNIHDAGILVATVHNDATNDIVKKSYFVLIFIDKQGELHAYDTKQPPSCLSSVLTQNKDFEFVHIIAEASEQSVRAVCGMIRSVRTIRERVKADMAKRTSAAAAAASPSS